MGFGGKREGRRWKWMERVGSGVEGRGMVGRGGEGLLNFNSIFQNTWAELGNTS